MEETRFPAGLLYLTGEIKQHSAALFRIVQRLCHLIEAFTVILQHMYGFCILPIECFQLIAHGDGCFLAVDQKLADPIFVDSFGLQA